MNSSDTRHERMISRPRLPENLLLRALELNEALVLLNSITTDEIKHQPQLAEINSTTQLNPTEITELDSYREAIRLAHEQGAAHDQKAA